MATHPKIDAAALIVNLEQQLEFIEARAEQLRVDLERVREFMRQAVREIRKDR